MLLCPEIKWSGSDFIDDRFREAILGQVHGFDVILAGVTTLHPDIVELSCDVDRHPSIIFLTASQTIRRNSHSAAQKEHISERRALSLS